MSTDEQQQQASTKRSPRKNIILRGVEISPGLASGKAFIYKDVLHRDQDIYAIQHHQIPQEHSRIKNAFEHVRKELRESAERVEAELNTELAGIFLAQEAILADPELTRETLAELEKELVNAEYVLQRVFRRWERKFRKMEDATFSQRADDIVDLGRRVLSSLQGLQAHILEKLPQGSVVVAQRLLPSDTIFLSSKSAVAVLVEYGGTGSHAALLTRALGIPAIGQIPDILSRIQHGEQLLVNGTENTVVCSPDQETLDAFTRQMDRYHERVECSQQRCHETAITSDGRTIEVMANITNREDVEHALKYGADGIGLYRTESFYLSQSMLPTEEQVLEHLRQTLAPARDFSITIRLLDVGGDKQLPYLSLPHENDPFLGRRGVRLLLEFPDLLETQLKAILRMSDSFTLRIMVPMVTLVDDMREIRQHLERLTTEMGLAEIPLLGAMIETPAAALCVKELSEFSDFFSIGTNDLTQYTMAVGRENPLVGKYFLDDHPVIFKLLTLICEQAGDVPVSLCGELAGNTNATRRILETGLHSLSVPAPQIPMLKETIRETRAIPAISKGR